MKFNVPPTLQSTIKFISIFGIVFIMGLIVYDVLFSKPLILQGVIVDKVYVHPENSSGQNVMPYMRYKSYDYVVKTEKHEQWIAFVKTEDEQILKVNCHSNHYLQKHVGDTLHFKEYTGDIFGIDYFSHNEEDQEKENALNL